MTTENFHASVQYGDFKGTAQADGHDRVDFRAHLEQKRLIKENEFLVGIEAWSGEITTQPSDKPLQVTALLAETRSHDSVKAAVDTGEPLPVRRVKLEMAPNVFFGFFKRFSISLSSHGLIDGKEITYDE
jgi:hypothetical protein